MESYSQAPGTKASIFNEWLVWKDMNRNSFIDWRNKHQSLGNETYSLEGNESYWMCLWANLNKIYIKDNCNLL